MDKKREKLIKVFLEKNNQINLSAIRDEEGVYNKHILDALEVHKVFDFQEGMQVCDVGTGGGFPLLPLAVEYPNINFTGMDSVRKKIDAIGDMTKQLGIGNIELLWKRAEEYKDKQFDVITARAVAYIDKLLPRTKHLLKQGGVWILFKQVDEQERQDLLQLCASMNLRLEKRHNYKLFEGDIDRVIYVIRRLGGTWKPR
ncbi:MAG: 16S rRNA (guanine(527)-N(7))-methyltransferase RsmG [Candidatus Absconditicoccaceae bacterium]